MRGTVVSVIPPFVNIVDNTPAVRGWSIMVKPDLPYVALLTTRFGITNGSGTIVCTVNVDDALINWMALLKLLSPAAGQKVRIVGTWCDNDTFSTTVICPIGILAIEYGINVYDIKGWPVAVRDIDFFAFTHATDSFLVSPDPHAGESRELTTLLPFPFIPSRSAKPFFRAYKSTEIDFAEAISFKIVAKAGVSMLEATVETGDPSDGKGFFAVQLGLTYDEPDLDNFCPPGHCDLEGDHCAHEGDFRYMRLAPHVPYAQKGDLVVSPGDGKGIISGIVASLSPNQVYDHMGIFVDNGQTIRHCTNSQDRLEAEDLFTGEITIKLAGIIELDQQKAPLTGLRPDLLRFGWPGSVTQTVEEVYQTGRNTNNLPWSYAATHPGSDTGDPENAGQPFFIYHLPRADRQRRLQFNDPEIDRGESVVRLQSTSVFIGNPQKEFKPKVIKPHAQFDKAVRPALNLVANMAMKIKAHYRFFAYTKGDVSLDNSYKAPPAGDSSWTSLPAGASWAAGSLPAMCSSFLWTAVQFANKSLPGGMLPIILEDKAQGQNTATGLEYGTQDGFYQYHEPERQQAAKNLVDKLKSKIKDKFDKKIPGIAYTALPHLATLRDTTAFYVSNQTANTFAFDAAEKLDESWKKPREGETASPDDTLHFWDLKPNDGKLVQPKGGQAIYGDSVDLQLSKAQWISLPLFRKQTTDLGTGVVRFKTFINEIQVAGVTVRFDFGCVTAISTLNKEPQDQVTLGTGTHFAEAFIVLSNPVSGNPETFRTKSPLKFDVDKNGIVSIDLKLAPPSDLARTIDVHMESDIHDRSFWGGDADHKEFSDDWHFDLQQDLNDNPLAPEDQQNTVLHYENVWRTEPEVGSGVHVAISIIADLKPSDRSVDCHCEIALIDTDSGGFLGIGRSSDVDQLEVHDVNIPADQFKDVLVKVNFSSDETVPERAQVSVRLTNRRRPS